MVQHTSPRNDEEGGPRKRVGLGATVVIAVIGLIVTAATTKGQEHDRARQLSLIAGQNPFTVNQTAASLVSGSLRGTQGLQAPPAGTRARRVQSSGGTNVTYTLQKASGATWAAIYLDVHEAGENGSAPVLVHSTRVFEMKFRRWFYNFFVTFGTFSNDFPALWIRNGCTDDIPSRIVDRILRQDEVTFDSGSGSHFPLTTEGVSIAHDYEWTGLPVGSVAAVQGQIDAELEACVLNQSPGSWNPAYVDVIRGLWAPVGVLCTALLGLCPALAAGGQVGGL